MRSGRRFGALILLVPLLGGCFTGQRPHFEEGPTNSSATGDAAIDAVLTRLDALATGAPFTAHLSVLTRFGSIETAVVVTQASADRRSVTIGTVRYISDGGRESTCDLTSGACTDGFDDTRVSDVVPTHEFFGPGAAARLRQDAQVRVGSTASSTEVFADQTATCVAVPVSGGTKTYCALDGGMLAKMDTADLLVTLTSFTPAADESLFATIA